MTTARDVLARLRLPDGRLWIDACYPFQVEDAAAVLDPDGPPYAYLTRSRGSSKTTDLSAVALALLLAADAPIRVYWLASDSDQGALALDAIGGFVSRTPSFAGRLELQARRVVVPETDARLTILPADEPSAWGLTPDAIIADELARWHDGPAARRLWEAASSAAAKNAACRLVVLTTAGSPDHFAAKVLDHAKSSPMWRVHEVAGPAPWIDPDRLAEQRCRLPQSVYEQLFENRWVAAEGSFLDPAVIDAAFVLDGPALEADPRYSYAAALDLGSVSDRTAFAVGHREGEAVHLDRLEVWAGTRARPVDFAEVERFIVEAHRRFGFRLRLDPWQGLDLAQRLRAQGVGAEEFAFSQGSKQRLAQTLLHSLNAGNLRLYDAEGLKDELLGLRLRQSASGAWSFDHAASGHDDRAVALALALVGVLEATPGLLPVAFGEPATSAADRSYRRLMDEGRAPGSRSFTADLLDRPM